MKNSALWIEVSIDDQEMRVIEGGRCVRSYPVSTSEKGMGFQEGSNRTPTGKFRVVEKIGGDQPCGTSFKARVPVGRWVDSSESQDDLILTRILRLEGLDRDNANTFERYIYIHGTNHEHRIGSPAGHGCVRLLNLDVIELFDRIPIGTELVIHPQTVPQGKLLFVVCDSTLSGMDGMNELARLTGGEAETAVRGLADAVKSGEMEIEEALRRQVEWLRPTRAMCDEVAAQMVKSLVPDAREMVAEAKRCGWLPVMLSEGLLPLVKPLAEALEIAHVEAIPVMFHDGGAYAGYDVNFPTSRKGGMVEVIRAWKSAVLPVRVTMIGDRDVDAESRGEIDCLVGCGSEVSGGVMMGVCDVWITSLSEGIDIWKRV